MSDHPVAGRGVGGLYRQVRAHGRAARANAVLDMSGARPLRGAHGVDHIAAVDAAGAFLGGQDRLAMLAGVAGVLDMSRPVAAGPPDHGPRLQVDSGQSSHGLSFTEAATPRAPRQSRAYARHLPL